MPTPAARPAPTTQKTRIWIVEVGIRSRLKTLVRRKATPITITRPVTVSPRPTRRCRPTVRSTPWLANAAPKRASGAMVIWTARIDTAPRAWGHPHARTRAVGPMLHANATARTTRSNVTWRPPVRGRLDSGRAPGAGPRRPGRGPRPSAGRTPGGAHPAERATTERARTGRLPDPAPRGARPRREGSPLCRGAGRRVGRSRFDAAAAVTGLLGHPSGVDLPPGRVLQDAPAWRAAALVRWPMDPRWART